MVRLLFVVLGGLRSAFRSHGDLVIENLALRQQLASFVDSARRPHISGAHRCFFVVLRRCWSRWLEVVVFVKPETVIRWHRAGFRRYWTWRSPLGRRGRPAIATELRTLIHRMATENPTWGAPRIHGELLMLGFDVSERTISRHLPRRSSRPDAVHRWVTFLRNHRDALAAMDFFVVPTVTLRTLDVLSLARIRSFENC